MNGGDKAYALAAPAAVGSGGEAGCVISQVADCHAGTRHHPVPETRASTPLQIMLVSVSTCARYRDGWKRACLAKTFLARCAGWAGSAQIDWPATCRILKTEREGVLRLCRACAILLLDEKILGQIETFFRVICAHCQPRPTSVEDG